MSIAVATRLFLGSIAVLLLSLVAHLPGAFAASGQLPDSTGPAVEFAALCSDSSFGEVTSAAVVGSPEGGVIGCADDDSRDCNASGVEDSPGDAGGELLEDEVDRDELLLVDDLVAAFFVTDGRLSSRTGPAPVCGSARFLDKPPRL